ncbi:MAG: aminotransferase class I/II-fold pyridoxal phosphate-dependent enzyme, partial [Anaerolineaceae bacterium]|nr:aminotransferase class I/II-fold pyridoxal phosphate-dependent enzyme [Anaerolineaceae bacterium]
MNPNPLPPFKLERYFARWEFSAPYLLCTSDIQGLALRDLLTLADPETLSLWDNLSLGYTETTGHPLLREEITHLYQQVSAEEVLGFAGAEEAIYIAQRVLLQPGDHMIVTFPGYQSSYSVAEAMGVEVSRWTLTTESGVDGRITWKADPGELRRLLRPNTRLVLVNFPHNPTGALPSLAEWKEIVG